MAQVNSKPVVLYPKPPQVHPKPKPSRLPREKRVTIAAGFVCAEGVVLCADTQETIAGYTKASTQKLLTWEFPEFTIAFAGAGNDSMLIDMVAQQIAGAFHYDPAVRKDWLTVEKTIRKVATEIFKKTISPFASFKGERPVADILIAVQFDSEVRLMRSRDTLFRYIYGAECAGTGELLFHSLRDKVYSSSAGLAQTARMAIYILNHAKKHVEGCGGNTDILLMRKGTRSYERLPTPDVRRLEEKFDKFDEEVKPLLLSFPDPNLSHDTFEDAVRHFRLGMLSLRGDSMGWNEFFYRLQQVTGIDLGIKPPITQAPPKP